jgi:adenylate kinase
MTARGEPLRPDDNPESLKKRLEAYRAQTAPLTDYYDRKGILKTVDGMATVEEVSSAIAAALGQPPDRAATVVPARRRPGAFRTAAARKAAQRRSAGRPARRVRSSGIPGAGKPAPARGKARTAKSETKPVKPPAAAARRGKKSAKAGIKVVVKRGGKTPTKPDDRPPRGKTGPGAKKRGRRG